MHFYWLYHKKRKNLQYRIRFLRKNLHLTVCFLRKCSDAAHEQHTNDNYFQKSDVMSIH